jgi:hypothetical protein
MPAGWVPVDTEGAAGNISKIIVGLSVEHADIRVSGAWAALVTSSKESEESSGVESACAP